MVPYKRVSNVSNPDDDDYSYAYDIKEEISNFRRIIRLHKCLDSSEIEISV